MQKSNTAGSFKGALYMSCISSLFFLFYTSAAQGAVTTVKGIVFDDANGNGLFDRGEQGICAVPVSNGDTVVTTDIHGAYQIPLAAGQSLFPVLPADYTMRKSRLVNSCFYYSQGKTRQPVNFALSRQAVRFRFRLKAIGDIQVSDMEELDYVSRTLWPELLVGDTAEVNLFLGDLVNNNLSLYPSVKTMMELLPSQSWTVLGNHDRDTDSIRQNQNHSYNAIFGSDVYAFNQGDVHFIILNNVYEQAGRGYEGRISDEQLSFVRNDIKYVNTNKLIVLCMHIPLSHTKNKHALLQQLNGHQNVLAITGHQHQVGRFLYQDQDVHVHELVAGAACGFWWVGEKDWDGIPVALQQGGTPKNYFILDFDSTKYTMRCKLIGQDESRQMTIHVSGIDTLDTQLHDMENRPAGLVQITVYGGCDSTDVRCRIDHGLWQSCLKSPLIDPNVARLREMNMLKAYPTRFNRINPLRRKESNQLWIFSLTDSQKCGAHTIEVKARDRWGFSASGIRSFCFTQQ